MIDIECQANLKLALGKRMRYYQSMIDIDSLMKGEEYENLKESYILFICKDDPFKDYKTVKVVYNASAYEKEEDSLIRNFLHFIYTGEPGEDDLSSHLSELVKQYKENETSRSDYLAVNLHDYDIRYEALQEGAQNKAVEAAVKIIKKYKATPEDAAKDVDAPLELVLEALKKA